MIINNIIIKEDKQDSYAPAQSKAEKYLDFTVDEHSSFVSSHVPQLLKQHKIVLSQQVSDFMELSIAVYTSDQIISRGEDGFQGWSRHIRVHYPVANIASWNNVKNDLEEMLAFLSGDRWEFIFRQRSSTSRIQPLPQQNPDGITKVSLFSGGLDSFIGAVDMLENREKLILVSHYKRGSEGKAQTVTASALETQYGKNSFTNHKFFVQPKQDNALAKKEDSSRARSFLFLGLGLAIANGLGDNIELIVPENGLISLNVPLTQTRLSSHSTRTTHPYYLSLFRKIIAALGINNQVSNPYQFKTKGEMMRECKNLPFLHKHYEHTLSCSHADNSRYEKGIKPGIHCGYCVPCIIRQAAEFAIGGVKTKYVHQVKYAAPSPSTRKGRDLKAFKMALAKVETLKPHSMVLHVLKSGPLPFTDRTELNKYIDIYLRGMAEVGNFLK